MPTLIVSDHSLPGEAALCAAARRQGWNCIRCDDSVTPSSDEELVVYVSTEVALLTAERFGLAFLEPEFDLLARLPRDYLLREVRFGRFRELQKLRTPTFVKPADPLNKCFDAGIYSRVSAIRHADRIDPDEPILLSEPVEWLCEFRCFVLDRRLVTVSPYLSFGRPNWHPFVPGNLGIAPTAPAVCFCERLLKDRNVALPDVFVVDVGLIDERGWAVVEFNPVWCAGILGADPARLLPLLRRACVRENVG